MREANDRVSTTGTQSILSRLAPLLYQLLTSTVEQGPRYLGLTSAHEDETRNN